MDMCDCKHKWELQDKWWYNLNILPFCLLTIYKCTKCGLQKDEHIGGIRTYRAEDGTVVEHNRLYRL